MKFCKTGLKVVNLSAIAGVDMHFPDEHSVEDWVELVIWFIGGQSTVYYGDEALALWKTIQLHSINLATPQLQKAS